MSEGLQPGPAADRDGPEAPTVPPALPAVPLDEYGRMVTPPPIPYEAIRPRSLGGRDLIAGVAILWGMEIVFGVLLIRVAAVAGVVGFVVLQMVGLAVTLVVSWAFVCRRYDKAFAEGFAIRPVPLKTIVLSAILALAMAAAAALFIGRFGRGKRLIGVESPDLPGLVAVVVWVLTVPMVEETYYRGFIFPVLRKVLGVLGAVLVATLWFTAAHLMQFVIEPAAIPVILVLGAILVLQREISGSLVPSIVTHLVYNAAVVAMSIVG